MIKKNKKIPSPPASPFLSPLARSDDAGRRRRLHAGLLLASTPDLGAVGAGGGPLARSGCCSPKKREREERCSLALDLQREREECNTPGVSHLLSSGFDLKHDMLSGNQEL